MPNQQIKAQKFLNDFKDNIHYLGTVRIPSAIQDYANNLSSGQYNHTQPKTRIPLVNKPYMGDFASQEFNNPLQNLLNPRWNYSNMGNAIQSERDSAARIP